MFTGIFEEMGTIRAVRRGRSSSVLSIGASMVLSDLKIGDSVAVNGVCLTATGKDDGGFTADVMHETLNRSSLGALTVGSHVNLERAMAADGRFGGHIVSGHIDGTGVELPAQAWTLRGRTVTQIGDDLLIEGEVEYHVHRTC